MSPEPSARSIDEVFALYRRWGGEAYDEAVSQSSHAVQVARLASDEGASDALVAAALLHDVGHLLALERGRDPASDEDDRHEAVGARWLAGLFPAEVTAPIALHVEAKRYRCAVDPGEHERLSAGSQASLVRQGGPMGPEEAARFARHPQADAAVRLRGWDDAGKDLAARPDPVDAYRDLLARVAPR